MPKVADAIFYENFDTYEDVTGLKNGQYELGGLVFGTRSLWLVHNKYLIQSFDVTEGSLTTGDTSLPNEDGIRFGVDFRGGMVLNFDMSLWNKGIEQGYDDVSTLKSIWQNSKFRTVSGEVTTLRMNRGGRTRRVYGRPRKFKETYGAIERGYAPITADFQCIDECFYDDTLTSQIIGFANPPTAGLTVPTVAPITISQYTSAYTNINILGTKSTWPVFKIKGPIVNPSFTLNGVWTCQLLTNLNFSQTITIDTRPWQRTAYRNDGVNCSGLFTSTSPIMREMNLAPGLHDLTFNGIDPTATSTLTVEWRAAWSTP